MAELKIRLFVKPYCPWCQQAQVWLDARGLRYDLLNVITNAEHRAQMFTLSGQTLAPVIEVNGEVLADFDTGQLETWWKQSGWGSLR